MNQNLPVMKWLTRRPERMIQNALLTRGNREGGRYVEMGAVPGKGSKWGQDILAYMIVPHMNEEPNRWKSEYLGDELPKSSGQYLCCAACDDGINPRGKIRLLWYDSKTARFGGAEMIGYMRAPAPYGGRKTMDGGGA
ncbi:MAG: hypothetical protein LUC87_00530 [Clostridiales bacterium]|nr:hypothetical protein [Clostridiales bacterium]